jgi:membrane-associated protein
MQPLLDLFSKLSDVRGIIQWGGYVGLTAIVFSETGLFVGFFLPGDSLLVTAGLFAAHGDLDIAFLFVLVAAAAVIGDATGFEIGRISGKRIFAKEDSRFFKKRHLVRTQQFYERHGGKTIILARFVPVIRTFAPLVAGVAGMTYRKFALYNITGGILWVGSMLGIGYGLGRAIPDIERYIHLVIAAVIFLSILPGIVSYLRSGHWKRWFERNGTKKTAP